MRVFTVSIAAMGLAAGIAACGSSSSTTSGPSTSSSADTAASSPSGQTINVGLIGSFSGTAGLSSTKSAENAWVSTVNAAGGINGHQVKLFIEDDGGTPAKAVVAVKQLVEQDHIIAIVGSDDFGLEAAWAPYIDAKKIPVIGGPASSPAWDTDPNFFPVGNNETNTLTGVVNAAALEKKTTFALAYCAEYPACAQAKPLYASIASKLGVKFTGGLPVSVSAVNYTAQCLGFKGQGAQSIFTSFASTTVPRFISSCRSQNYAPLFVDDPASWLQTQISDSSFKGVIFASEGPLWFGDGPGTAAYLAAVTKYAPNDPRNSSGTIGWYAAQVFAAAIAKSGAAGLPTSADVYKGLYALGPNFDLGGVIAPVTYTQGKPAVQQFCGWYMQVVNGKETAPFGTKRICS
jgi:branched-chain amino acid transport system substrate-binding protein